MINILLVDDNENNRLALELLLEEVEDVEIAEATTGQEAVEMCKTKLYDLIFMDIMMPVMDGIEATIYIKEISKASMIIALSALEDKESKQRMLLAGAEDYLTKPIDGDLFLQRTNNYIKIINLRSKQTINNNALNPFTTTVYDRRLTFFIKSEESIAQFWDFFLKDNLFNCIDFSDYIRIVYGFSKWLIKNNKEFTIDVEGSKTNLYIMINGIDSIKKTTIQNIIIRHIPNALFVLENGTLSFKLTKIEEVEKGIVETNSETKDILSKTHYDNPTAVQYVEGLAISFMSKLESLEEIEDKINEFIIEFEKNPNRETMEKICEQFDEYYSVIELLPSFDHLMFAIKSLITFLRSLDEEKFKNDNINTFSTLLLSLLNDLESWRDIIFIKQEAIDIHYLDASLLSSCLQIEAIFEAKEVDEGDDLEFF